MTDQGYVKQRSFQNIENQGDGQFAAQNSGFEHTAIEENEGKFSRVGRDPEDGVAVTIEDYSTLDVKPETTPLSQESAEEKASVTGVSNLRVEDGFYIGDSSDLGKMIIGRAPSTNVRPLNADDEPLSNVDGTFSTERTITVQDPALNGGEPTLIPSIWSVDDKVVELPFDDAGQRQAIEYAAQSGLEYPSFKTVEDADTFAQARSQTGGARQGAITEDAGGQLVRKTEEFLNAPFAGLSQGVAKFVGNSLGAIGVLEQKEVDKFFKAVDEIGKTEDNPAATIGGAVGEISGQFILPAAGIYTKVKALGASPIVASLIAELGVGAFGMSPDEGNLFNMIPKDSEAFSTVRDLLATDPENKTEWENRSANAIEALILLGAGEAVVRFAIGSLKKIKEVAKSPVAEQLERVSQETPGEGGILDEIIEDSQLPGQVPTPTADTPFFSSVEKAVEALTQEKGTAKQMKAMIAKSTGVKKEEMAWIGLDDFLKGNNKVTKQEILDFVRKNKVELRDVTLGGGFRDPVDIYSDEALAVVRGDIIANLGDADQSIIDQLDLALARAGSPDTRQVGLDTIDDILEAHEIRSTADDLIHDATPPPDVDEASIVTRTLDALDDNAEAVEASKTLKELGFTPDLDDSTGYLGFMDHRGNHLSPNQLAMHDSNEVVNAAADFESIFEVELDALTAATGTTKFSDYTLPGGENYREVLLTLPGKGEGSGFSVMEAQVFHGGQSQEDFISRTLSNPNEDIANYSVRGALEVTDFGKDHATVRYVISDNQVDGIADEYGWELLSPVKDYDGRGIEAFKKHSRSDFIGGHFDEPNVVAHLRLNDRVGPNGEKILFIEEIQSDWHQAGRKQGYDTGDLPEGWRMTRVTEKTATDPVMIGWYEFNGPNPGSKYITKTREQGEQLVRDNFGNGQTGVPDAPLKGTWQETAFRRAAHMAATEGYDKIAWTPGKIQADRYDLSKQISRVDLVKTSGGVGKAKDAPLEEGWTIHAFDNSHNKVINTRVDSEEGLVDLIGKEAADRLLKAEATESRIAGMGTITRSIEGEDLKVGGEGMEAFYDRIVKNYANKFGKKFGSKVETTKIETPLVSEADFDRVENLSEEAIDKIDEGTEVWSLPVTEKMQDTAKSEGFPLFSSAAIPLAATGQEDEDTEVASAASTFLKKMLGLGGQASKLADVGKELSNYTHMKDQAVTKGAEFNLKNMNTTEEVKNQINVVSKAYPAAEGPVPQELTKDLAELLGGTPQDASAAVRSLPGDVKDLHVRALTMRNLLVSSAEETDRLARVVSGGGPDVSDGDYLRFREQIVRHAQLQSQMKGVQTEIARALSSFRIPAEAGARNPQIVGELIDRLGGRATAQEIADRWLKTPLDRRAQFAGRSMWVKSRAAAYEIWINGLLSGLRTQQVNIAGNSIFMAFQIPERLGAATIGTVFRSPDRVRFQEVWAQLRGGAFGTVDGVKLAWRTLRTEMPSDGISKIEAQTLKAITPENFDLDPNSVAGRAVDIIGQGMRLPGRGLMTMDEFYKATGYRMEVDALTTRSILNARDQGEMSELIIDLSARIPESEVATAARLTELRETADTRNLSREELGEVYQLMRNNPSTDIQSASHDFATMITFQTELGDTGKALQTFLSRVPLGRVIAPFIRTPVNIVKEFGRRTPVARMMPTVSADLAAGGARRDLALSRIGLGTSMMTYALFLSLEGNITGGGPSRGEGTYAAWRETHAPYSMKIGDRWVPYGRLEPLAMLFGSVADAVDFMKYSGDEEANQSVYMAALTGVIKNVSDKTFLQGISNFSDAYSDPARYGERYITNLARSTIPFSSMMRDITRSIDPVMRQTRAGPDEGRPLNRLLERTLNEFKASLPGFSKDLPPKRTFWGEERRAYEGGPMNAFNAFSTKAIKESPIDEELVRLSQPMSMPSHRIGNIELTNQQYDDLIVKMNKAPIDMPDIQLVQKYGVVNIRTAMNNLVQSPLWEIIDSNEIKIEHLKKIRNDYVDAAKRALALDDEDIAKAQQDEQADRILLEGQRGLIQKLGPINTQIESPSGAN